MKCYFSKRIYKYNLDNNIINQIAELSSLFNSCKYSAFAFLTKEARYGKQDVSLYDYLKNNYNELDIYARNSAMNEAKATLSSQLELKKLYIDNIKDKLNKTTKKYNATITYYNSLKEFHQKLISGEKIKSKTYKFKTNGAVVVCKQHKDDISFDNKYLFEKQYLNPLLRKQRSKIGLLLFKINKLQLQLDKLSSKTYIPSVCFGTKKLLKQSQIKTNMTKSERKQCNKNKRLFQYKRNKQFMVSGRKDSINGNFFFAYNPFNKTLSFKFKEQDIIINNVSFPYGEEEIREYFLNHKGNLKNNKTKAKPITFEIVDNGDYYIVKCQLSSEKEQYANYYKETGVIAIDMNVGFVSVAETNSKGQLIYTKDYHYQYKSKNSNQIKNSIEETIKEVVALAEKNNKPIVCEELKLKGRVKQSDYNDNKSKNFTRSMFAYNKLGTALESRCNKCSVGIIKVSPAYTSYIGKKKYVSIYHKSVHKMAAYVIGRRGQGFNEKLPTELNIIATQLLDKQQSNKYNNLNKWMTLYKAKS